MTHVVLLALVLASRLWAAQSPHARYAGLYELAPGHVVSIGGDASEFTLTDYASGDVRLLAAVNNSQFVAGPSFGVTSPTEIRLTFIKNAERRVSGARILSQGATRYARRVLFRHEEVSFGNGNVRLGGTLVLPNRAPPFPAVVRTHGAGAAEDGLSPRDA